MPSASFGSAQAQSTTTPLVYQPAAFGVVVGWPLTVGAPRSILSPDTDPLPVLPALSLIAAEAPRLRPSPVTTLSAGWLVGSIPDSLSLPTHLTRTLPLYQSAPFGLPGRPVRVGAVLSMFTGP